MDYVSVGHWQTGLQPHRCLPLTHLPTSQAGKQGQAAARSLGSCTAHTNRGEKHHVMSVLVEGSKHPQGPLRLLDRPGQRAEMNCNSYQDLHITRVSQPSS